MSRNFDERTGRAGARAELIEKSKARAHEVVELARRLVGTPSENPPGDTREIAELVAGILEATPGAEVEKIESRPPVMNVVARIRGAAGGRRLVINGHLDTFPVGERNGWSVDPLGGEIRCGRLYGRGVSDMKGGVAASIFAFRLLGEFAHWWTGELVLTLVGDEETMGQLGTGYLLEHHPLASGDAMICGDAGSPNVLRFGEKGLLWLTLEASGRAAHGAHVHLGESAIERLIEAMQRLTSLRELAVDTPPDVAAAISAASERSEALSGKGETKVLTAVTVNFGMIAGGSAPNLIANHASTYVDIRLPAGVTAASVEARIAELTGALPGVSYTVVNRFDASWTPPDHEIVATMSAACAVIFSEAPATNMRVGASDARYYRARGIPTVVCGPTPHGMGGADEYVEVAELEKLAQVFALATFDYLARVTS